MGKWVSQMWRSDWVRETGLFCLCLKVSFTFTNILWARHWATCLYQHKCDTLSRHTVLPFSEIDKMDGTGHAPSSLRPFLPWFAMGRVNLSAPLEWGLAVWLALAGGTVIRGFGVLVWCDLESCASALCLKKVVPQSCWSQPGATLRQSQVSCSPCRERNKCFLL